MFQWYFVQFLTKDSYLLNKKTSKRRRIDAVTGSPVDRRTVDRSVVSFRAAAAVPRVRVRLAKRWPVFRLATGGSSAILAESPAAVAESIAATRSVVLLQARDASQLSK